jgi:hypothetical protein
MGATSEFHGSVMEVIVDGNSVLLVTLCACAAAHGRRFFR